jgi:hypothetical protein
LIKKIRKGDSVVEKDEAIIEEFSSIDHVNNFNSNVAGELYSPQKEEQSKEVESKTQRQEQKKKNKKTRTI